MKKIILFLLLLFVINFISFSQNQNKIDSLLNRLKIAKEDTLKAYMLNDLALEFVNNNPDTAVYFANEALKIASKVNYPMGISNAYLLMGRANTALGKYGEALKNS